MRRFLFLLVMLPASVVAQEKHDEQFYRPGAFNWRFLHAYPEAARLFNAFDYGHAVLYETLPPGKSIFSGPFNTNAITDVPCGR